MRGTYPAAHRAPSSPFRYPGKGRDGVVGSFSNRAGNRRRRSGGHPRAHPRLGHAGGGRQGPHRERQAGRARGCAAGRSTTDVDSGRHVDARSTGGRAQNLTCPRDGSHRFRPDAADPQQLIRLLRQIRTNQGRGIGKLPGRNPNPLSTLRVATWVVRRPSLTSGAIKCRELGRPYTPITPFLPGNNMEMEVRRFLSAEDAVVLKGKYPERPTGPDHRLCDSLGRGQHSRAFLAGKIE